MTVREQEDENGGTSSKWAVIPLGRWRLVGAKTGKSLLFIWSVAANRGIVCMRESGKSGVVRCRFSFE
jgi:hypothetical protein